MNNNYRIAGKSEARAQLARRLDRVVSEKLNEALEGAALDFADESGELYFIRRLDLRLWLNASRLNDTEIARNWAIALARAMHRQIHDADPDNVIRYRSQAEFLATWVGDVLGQRATGQWQYAEFEELHDLPAGQAISLALIRDPRWIGPVFKLLGENQTAAPLVAAMTSRDISVIWQAWVGEAPELRDDVPLTLVQSVVEQDLQRPGFEFGGSEARARMALRWLVTLSLGKAGLPASVAARLAMQLGHLGAALHAVPDLAILLASPTPDQATLQELLGKLPNDMTQTRAWIAKLAQRSDHDQSRTVLVQIHQGSLARVSRTETPESEDKIISAFAGVGLMLPVLRDSGLWESLGPAGRVAILAHAMTGAERLLARSDNGLRQMAGLPQNVVLDDYLHEVDWTGGVALTDADKASHGESDLTRVLRKLLDLFSHDLRGMRGASLAYLCNQFMVRPGTLIRTRSRLLIRIDSVPLKVLLQLAGRLDDQGTLPWHDDVELRLEAGNG